MELKGALAIPFLTLFKKALSSQRRALSVHSYIHHAHGQVDNVQESIQKCSVHM